MQIIRFYAKWCNKCKIFSDKERLGYDTEVDIDAPSSKAFMLKYQISIIPTFVAIANNGRVKGKLSNPLDVEEYENWKKKFTRK